MKGSLPLWDPFSNGGQPFYPLLIQFRLLEPIILLTIGIGQFFTKNTVILFNLSKILQTFCMCAGAYFCLYRYTRHTLTRVLLIPILLFSSFSLDGFHQDGMLSQFLWVPWLIHFLICLLLERDYRWHRFLLAAVFVGLSWQSYQFVGTWTCLLLFFTAVFLFYRNTLYELWRETGNKKKILLSSVIVLAMMAPNLVLISESSRFVFPLRMAPKDFKERLLKETGLPPAEPDPSAVDIGIKMPYEMIPYTGAMVKVWEIIQTLSPNANANIHAYRNPDTWGTPSEAFIYFSMLAWALCLLGFTSGDSAHRKLWLLMTLSFGLLMMGPPGGLHRVLFYIFPPLWFLRHTTLFVLFFQMGCLYFFVSGFEKIREKNFKISIPTSGWATLLPFVVVLFTFGVFATKLDYPVFKFPETNFVFVIFLLLAFSARRVFPMIGREGLWLALLATQAGLVLFLSKNKADTTLHLAYFLAIPLLLVRMAKVTKKKKSVFWAFAVTLAFSDLLFSFWSAGRLYESQESPEALFSLPMTAHPLEVRPRAVHPSYPSVLYGRQAPRYLSLLHQKPYALSGVLYFKNSVPPENSQTMDFALSAERWNSYLLERNYFKLIHQQLSPRILSKLFLIGEGPLKLYSNAFPESAFLELAKLGNGEKILEKAVIISDREPIHSTSVDISSSEVTTLDYSYNHWRGTVRTEGAAYFLFGDGFDRFWTAKIDGKVSKVLRLNLNSKGVYIEKGTHFIEFEYRPAPFVAATALFLLIPLLVLVGIGIHHRRSIAKSPELDFITLPPIKTLPSA